MLNGTNKARSRKVYKFLLRMTSNQVIEPLRRFCFRGFKKMNKMMKTLLSVLLVVLIAMPAAVVGDLSDDTDRQVLTSTDFTDSLLTDNVDLKVPTSADTDTSKVTPVVYKLTIDGINFGDVSIADAKHSAYPFFTITVNNLYARIGAETSEDLVKVSDTVDNSLPVVLTHTDGTTYNLGNIEVSVRDAVEEDDQLFDGLITEIDLEEDELTFGDEVEFEIELENTGDNVVEDAYFEVALFDGDDKIEGWIESENDNIRIDEEDDDVTYDQDDLRKSLIVPSSEDLDVDDVATVTLRVRVFGDYDGANQHLLDTYSTTFEVEKLEDHISIDTISIEQQGNVLYTAITVENDGEDNQEDIRAQVTIRDLDVKQTSNEVTVYEDDETTIYVPVVLPALASGEYNIKVTVYNDDVSTTQTVEDFELTGIVAPSTEATLLIGVDTAAKTVSENGAVYAMTFTNNGVNARTFSLETAGAEWGQTSVNPGTVVVGPGTSEIASIFVAPNAGEQGTRQFTVFIKEGAQIVKSVSLTANVEGSTGVTGSAVGGFDDLVNSGLKWIAAILIVVLIVLFVVWSWNRDEEEL
jgi:hypothetical protein